MVREGKMGIFVRALCFASGVAVAGAAASTVNLPATLVAAGETVKNVVTSGPSTSECPVWDPVGGALYFTDYGGLVAGKGVVWKVIPGNSPVAPTSFKSGLNVACAMKLYQPGKLVLGESGKISLLQISTQTMTTLATATASGEFATGCNVNDCSVAPDGGIFFTYNKGGSTSYVYYLPAGGTPQKKLTSGSFPNGIIYVPEKKILYVGMGDLGTIQKYSVNAQFNLGANPTTFATNLSSPDGMVLDEKGNMYVTHGSGIKVFDSTGNSLGTITLNAGSGNVTPTNCCFGGSDNQTLFIDGGSNVFSLHMSVKGRAVTGIAKGERSLPRAAARAAPTAKVVTLSKGAVSGSRSGTVFSASGRISGARGMRSGAVSNKASGIYFVKTAQ
jgi:gluconolactonase